MASPFGSGKDILDGLSSIACLWCGSPSLMINSLKRKVFCSLSERLVDYLIFRIGLLC